MTNTVRRYDFIDNKVVYTTIVAGAAFQSIHERNGLTDEQAKQAFHREHNAEVLILLRQKAQNEPLIIQ
jgi:hypothetical protein